MTRLVPIAVADIGMGVRQRPVRPGVAQAYADSYTQGAALPPILVRPVTDGDTPYLLVAGGHRLAGARLAGIDTLLAEVRNLNDDEAALMEAEENLVRHTLGFLDRAVALTAHKGAYERLHPEARHGGDRKSKFLKKQQEIKWQSLPLDQRPFDEAPFKTFSEAAAAALDLSPRTIRDAITLMGRLDAEAVRLLQPLPVADRRIEIELLATFEPDRQRHMARLIAEGKANSVRDALAFGDFDSKPINHGKVVAERGLARFQDWLTRAPAKHGDLIVSQCARPLAEAFRRAGWTMIAPDGDAS